MTTAAEGRHLDRLAQCGCILCHHLGLGFTEPQIHHPRTGQGLSQRASHWLAIPLCPEHHLGNTGLHGLGTRAFARMYQLDEFELLAMTLGRVYG